MLINTKQALFTSIETWSLFGCKSNCFASFGHLPWEHSEETSAWQSNYLITLLGAFIDAPPSGAEFENEWSYNSSARIRFHDWHRGISLPLSTHR
jgi:hypothetical protein